MVRPVIFLFLYIFIGNAWANEKYSCGEYLIKSNKDNVECNKDRFKVSTVNSNVELVSIKKYSIPMTISVDLYDPMYMHWAGIRIGNNLLIKINNENRRLEILEKKIVWEEKEFIDSYHIFKERNDRLTLQVSLNRKGGIIVQLDDKNVIVTTGYKIDQRDIHVALLSGWKSSIAWSHPSISSMDVKNERALSSFVGLNTNKNYISGVLLNSKNHLYRDDSVVDITLKRNIIQNFKPEFCVFSDVYGKKVGEVKLDNINLNSEVICRYKPSQRGIFTVGLGWANAKLPKTIATFVVLPPEPIKLSKYLGIHIDGLEPDWHIDTARSIGMNLIRLHDGVQTGWWTRIQPEDKSHWNWPYDVFQRDLVKNNMHSLGVLLWTPKWASVDKNINSPPINVSQYKKYVERVVSRYKDSTYAWEIWNEPYSKYYWKGTVYDYVNLVKNASEVIKKVDPNLKVVGGVVTPFDSEWNKNLFKSNILNYIDIFSIHFSELDYAHDILSRFVKKLRLIGFKGEVWNTESRVYSQSLVDIDSSNINEQSVLYHKNAAYKLIELILANLSAGVDRIFYYHLFNPARWGESTSKMQNIINTGLWSRDNNPNTLVSAIAAFNYLVSDKAFIRRLKIKQADYYLFKNEGSVLAIQQSSNLLDREAPVCKLPAKEFLKKCQAIFYDFQGNKIDMKSGSEKIYLSPEPWYLKCLGGFAQKNIVNLIKNITCTVG